MYIQELINQIKRTIDSHKLKNEGEYCRYLWQNDTGDRKMGLNEYGCADAVNILYTINDFLTDGKSREAHIEVLRSMQDKESGLFREETHHFIHTTAHCTAALELLDARPKYPLNALKKYTDPNELTKFLDELDWENQPWPQAHRGAGIYASLKLTDMVDRKWENTYFKWLWDNEDPDFGFWKKGVIGKDKDQLFAAMGGGFHYLFNIEYAKRPLRYPEKIIDTCLELYKNGKIGDKVCGYDNDKFGRYIGFLEVDWAYSINRSLRQSGYRRSDCIDALSKFTDEYIEWLYSIDYLTHDGFNDLHMLFGTCCALAELQTALPGKLETDKPLRLVLDRRPFI